MVDLIEEFGLLSISLLLHGLQEHQERNCKELLLGETHDVAGAHQAKNWLDFPPGN